MFDTSPFVHVIKARVVINVELANLSLSISLFRRLFAQ
jgi:hypothetical protein